MDIAIISAVLSGILALLGGFGGAWLTRKTEYGKWLRQERSIAFAEFLKQMHSTSLAALNIKFDSDRPEKDRSIDIVQLFVQLDGQKAIVRLYLEKDDRDKLSVLINKLCIFYDPSTDKEIALSLRSADTIMNEVQSIFERTIDG